jgi:hypothetical protein
MNLEDLIYELRCALRWMQYPAPLQDRPGRRFDDLLGFPTPCRLLPVTLRPAVVS